MRRAALLLFGSIIWAGACAISACSDSTSTDDSDAGATCDDRTISCRGGSRAALLCSTATCGSLAAYCFVTHAPSASQVPAGCVDLTAGGAAGCAANATDSMACVEFYCCPDLAVVDGAADSPPASDASDASDALDAAGDASEAGDASPE